MNQIKDICSKFSFVPTKYRLLGNVTIVENAKNEKLVIKKKQIDKNHLYQYLKTRGFHYFPPLLEDRTSYEVYPFIEDIETPKEQKALDIIYLVSLLHNKTTFYKEVDLNRMKAFYEEKNEAIQYLFHYYQDLQSIIEKHVYMSPSEYLFIRHTSFLYQMLSLIKNLLEEWYKEQSAIKRERYALVHHNLTLDHFIEQDQGYLISWDQAKIDIPIYDFYSFYENNPIDLDYMSLLEVYESKYPLLKEEELRLFILLGIPRKIVLKKDESSSTREIYKEIKRLKKVYEMILKKNQKNA